MIGKFILFTDFLKNFSIIDNLLNIIVPWISFFFKYNCLNIIVLHDFLKENYNILILR